MFLLWHGDSHRAAVQGQRKLALLNKALDAWCVVTTASVLGVNALILMSPHCVGECVCVFPPPFILHLSPSSVLMVYFLIFKKSNCCLLIYSCKYK